MQLKSINPKNNININSWDVLSQNEINHIINNASIAQLDWGPLKLDSKLFSIIDFLINVISLLDRVKSLFLK